jgi:hypothetical protein
MCEGHCFAQHIINAAAHQVVLARGLVGGPAVNRPAAYATRAPRPLSSATRRMRPSPRSTGHTQRELFQRQEELCDRFVLSYFREEF